MAELTAAAELQVRTEYEKTVETLRGEVATLRRQLKEANEALTSYAFEIAAINQSYRDLAEGIRALLPQ